jgi:RNA polymerase sigma factor FliA
MAIHFVSPDRLSEHRDQPGPRQGSPAARSGRTRVCSKGRPGNSVHRGPCQAQKDLNNLIVGMMPLVKRVALQLRGRLPAHVELCDLVSAGALGLIDAVRKFDPGRGVSIESYARFRIRGAILDSLRNDDPASRDMRRKIKNIESVSRNLAFQLGRPPGDGEIARALGLGLSEWHEMVSELQQLGVEGTATNTFREVRQRVNEENLADSTADDPFSLCYRREQRDILNQALQCLTERERSIVALYYQGDQTMKQIGVRLGIDESRVSQLHSAAIVRLRAHVAATLRRASGGSGAGMMPPQAATAVHP